MHTDTMEHAAQRRLEAALFAITGKLPVLLVALDAMGAEAILADPPPAGSIAIVVRNRIRIFCTVTAVAGDRVTLAFDDPLAGWRMEDFAGRGMPVDA